MYKPAPGELGANAKQADGLLADKAIIGAEPQTNEMQFGLFQYIIPILPTRVFGMRHRLNTNRTRLCTCMYCTYKYKCTFLSTLELYAARSDAALATHVEVVNDAALAESVDTR